MRDSIPWDDYDKYKNAFVIGQRVVAVNAMPGAGFKNGTEYIVANFTWKYCHNGNRFFWYIGIVGTSEGQAHYRPSIFAPVQYKSISFEKVMEQELTSEN